jgi:hypothetical protein
MRALVLARDIVKRGLVMQGDVLGRVRSRLAVVSAVPAPAVSLDPGACSDESGLEQDIEVAEQSERPPQSKAQALLLVITP